MLENIKLNEKYTILIENTLGFIVSRQVKLTHIEFKPYAQYNKTLVVNFISKGKRKAEGWRYMQDQRIAIVEGWQEIKGTFQDKSLDTFESFEMGRFDKIIEMNELKPVYLQ